MLGVCGLIQLSELPDGGFGQLLPFALFGALLASRWRLVCLLIAGFLWALLRAHMAMEGNLPPALEGRDLVVQGSIVSIPVHKGYRKRFVFLVEGGSERNVWSGRTRLSWYHPTMGLQAGQRWRLTVRLKRPRGFKNPGGLDYEKWLFQHRIAATGYVRARGEAVLLEELAGQPINRARGRILAFIETVLNQHRQRGTVAALAIGDRQSISTQQWMVLRSTGTNHLMAISGLHIGLVAGGGFFSMFWMWSRSVRACLVLAAPRAGAVAALAAAIFYAGLADFSIPTQRALVMVALVMVNLIAARRSAPTTVLAAALLAVLLVDPFAVLSPGFWLSFAAVAVILLSVSGRSAGSERWSGWWWRWGRVQTMVALGLSPLTLVFFSQMSMSAPLANMLAVPWVGIIVVPLTLGGVILMPLSDASAGFLILMAAEALDLLWWFLERLETFPLVLDEIPALGIWATVSLATLTALWLMPPGVPGRWLAVLAIPLLFFRASNGPEPGALELTVLDVGQGLSVVARTHGHVLVFDTGPRYATGFDTGEMVVVPFLRARSVRKVDILLISHGDNDHAGGTASVAGSIRTGRIMTNTDLGLGPVSPCLAGESWEWDGVGFEILGPVSVPENDGNNGSCVLQIATPAWRILLPGDIESSAEDGLLRRLSGSRLRSDILVAPHHGSRTSSGSGFLDAVRPDHVVFPVGFNNRFGFPHADVLDRYRRRGIALHDTAQDGAVTFTLLPRGAVGEPGKFRDHAKRFWNQ